MPESLAALEAQREQLSQQVSRLGDFRPGTISVNYRRCGKPNCVCARPGHPGHGPQYLWTSTRQGKSRAQNLHLGPEVAKVEKELDNYRHFLEVCAELVRVNEEICRLRPAPEVGDERELERLKKTLRQKYQRRRRKR